MLLRSLCFALVPLLGAGSAGAQRVDGIELAFGASNLQGVTGNGRLTVGVSPDGDVSVLSWPSPSYFDQVHALQANGVGARHLPRMGLEDGMGVFALLAEEAEDGSVRVTRLHDDAVARDLRYAADDSSVVVARFTLPSGTVVVQRDVVPPGLDVLVRRYRVQRAPGAGRAWLLAYENLSPSLSKIPKIPMADVLLDHKHDFLAAWDEARGELVHFHPGDTGVVDNLLGALGEVARDFGPLGGLLREAAPSDDALDALLLDLDAAYAPGVYAAITTLPAPDQWQVGEDATDTCGAIDEWIDHVQELPTLLPDQHLPGDPSLFDEARCGSFDPTGDVAVAEGWSQRPDDALAAALAGELPGARLAGGQVNAALRVPLTFSLEGDDEVAEAAVLLAFGETHRSARNLLDEARARGAADLEEEARAADAAFVSGLRLPSGGSDDLLAFSKRTLLNLRVGTCAETGATVASISRQPPYQLDWPRDGAFFNAALDLSGQHELVTKRLRFYASVLRDDASPPVFLVDQPVPGWPGCDDCQDYPADSWEMNYYADGVVGGNIRLEIDNTALLVWSFVAHAGYLQGAARTTYLEEMWPAVRRATSFLAGWRDAANGLVWLANEDDHAEFTQDLQGAVTVFGALRAAARYARALGHEEEALAWAERAGELREAIFEHLYEPGEGFLRRLREPGDEEPPLAGGGASSWAAWPARVLAWDDERLRGQLRRDLDKQMPRVRGEGPGGSYTTKTGVAAALVLADGPEREVASEMVERLAGEIASPRTRQLGEVFVNVDDDGDGETDRRENAVATPHLWAASLVYLGAMAVHDAALFDPHEEVLPPVHIPGDPTDEGCSCSAASRQVAGGELVALLASAAWLSRRRRRQAA